MILTDAEAGEARAELTEVVATMLDKIAPRTDAVLRADAAAAGELDRVLWERLNSELGAAGLAVPETWGGSGATVAELAVTAEGLGRNLSTVPLLGTWLALTALTGLAAADGAAGAVIGDLLESGEAAAVVLDVAAISAAEESGSWQLTGVAPRIIDGSAAGWLVVAAQAPDGVGWFVVEAGSISRQRLDSLDLTRDLTTLTFAATPARRIGTGDGSNLVETVRNVAAVLVASEQLGVAEQAVADAVGYAGEREQFGRRIGSFQSIKHIVADLATAADLARSLVEHAVWAAVQAPDELPAAAAAALVESSRAATAITAENVQIHGGIGFSWEHPAHLYFRKARSNEMLLGPCAEWSDRAFYAYLGTAVDGDD